MPALEADPSLRLRQQQWEKLQALLREIIPANPFYTARFKDRLPLKNWEDFHSLPLTTKAELVSDQAVHPPYGSNLTFSMEKYSRCHQTSGTSGKPLRWLDTPASWQWMLDNWKSIFQAAGVTSRDTAFFAFSFGPFLGFWTAFEAASQLGCLCLPGGGLSSIVRLKTILEQKATVLCCTPTYALHLGEVASAEGLNFSALRLRTLIVAGEAGGSLPAVRQRLESAWPGARIFDHHGMTEVGPVSYECPRQPGVLHILEKSYIAEIVDPHLQPVPPGTAGELLLTTLGRVGSPLLRYRTGDLVRQASGHCSCGSPELALEGGILGRIDDMIVVRGVNIFPGAVESLVREIPEIVEYRALVFRDRALAELEVEIEISEEASAEAVMQQLQHRFETSFQMRVPVRIVPKETLPRFELKARRWVVSPPGPA